MNHPWSGHGNMSTLFLWEILQDGLLTFWLPPRDSNLRRLAGVSESEPSEDERETAAEIPSAARDL